MANVAVLPGSSKWRPVSPNLPPPASPAGSIWPERAESASWALPFTGSLRNQPFRGLGELRRASLLYNRGIMSRV